MPATPDDHSDYMTEAELMNALEEAQEENKRLRNALAHLIQVDDTSVPRDLTYYQQVLREAKEAISG